MKRNILIIILGILFTQFSQAQELTPKAAKLLATGDLRIFPATQILNVIESLQSDLKNCEATNAKIITNERNLNKKLTWQLSETQQLLSRAETRADSLSHTVGVIHTNSVSAKKDVKTLGWLKYVDRFGTIAGAAFLGYLITKK